MNDRSAFERDYDVPRETMARFDAYAALLVDWQARMNLVGPATLPAVWVRHFADSAQLLAVAGAAKTWLDIGAGAGFPGIVVALLDAKAQVTLVESIAKKCRFLSATAEVLQLSDRVHVENRRVETLSRQKFDIITARALAALPQIFDWGLPFAGSGTHWLLPKGARARDELSAAQAGFVFDYRLVPSRTDADARLVVATGVKRR